MSRVTVRYSSSRSESLYSFRAMPFTLTFTSTPGSSSVTAIFLEGSIVPSSCNRLVGKAGANELAATGLAGVHASSGFDGRNRNLRTRLVVWVSYRLDELTHSATVRLKRRKVEFKH